MHTLSSRIAPSGHVVLVRLPDDARFEGRFADDGSVRDITAFAPNLLLSGALDAIEASSAQRPAPADEVDAVEVTYLEAPAAPGVLRAAASFTWMHLPSGECGDFPAEDVIGLLVRGLSVELTAAVAAEVAEVPDDASELDG